MKIIEKHNTKAIRSAMRALFVWTELRLGLVMEDTWGLHLEG